VWLILIINLDFKHVSKAVIIRDARGLMKMINDKILLPLLAVIRLIILTGFEEP
jgi:hypothetical protein